MSDTPEKGAALGIDKQAKEALDAMKELLVAAREAALQADDNRRLTAAALTEAQAKLAEISATATFALAAKTQIADEQGVIATKSHHIEGAQEHADTVRAELDRALTSAKQQATEAEGLKARAQSAADLATGHLSEIQATHASADADSAAIVIERDAAKEFTADIKALADKSATVETRVSDYEASIDGLKKRSIELLTQIENLIPGATSVGLAEAFDRRREAFIKPGLGWQRVFVGSLAVLILLALTGLWQVYTSGTPLTYDELGRVWLARLPVAGALVWLAIHASQESALAKRLEEDYGYKAAIASSFQGFQRQMKQIGAEATPDSPLSKLCVDTLATIASPPGRIYDKHKLVASPADVAKDGAKDVARVLTPGKEASVASKQP